MGERKKGVYTIGKRYITDDGVMRTLTRFDFCGLDGIAFCKNECLGHPVFGPYKPYGCNYSNGHQILKEAPQQEEEQKPPTDDHRGNYIVGRRYVVDGEIKTCTGHRYCDDPCNLFDGTCKGEPVFDGEEYDCSHSSNLRDYPEHHEPQPVAMPKSVTSDKILEDKIHQMIQDEMLK